MGGSKSYNSLNQELPSLGSCYVFITDHPKVSLWISQPKVVMSISWYSFVLVDLDQVISAYNGNLQHNYIKSEWDDKRHFLITIYRSQNKKFAQDTLAQANLVSFHLCGADSHGCICRQWKESLFSTIRHTKTCSTNFDKRQKDPQITNNKAVMVTTTYAMKVFRIRNGYWCMFLAFRPRPCVNN